MENKQFYIGKITKIDKKLIAEINIFSNSPSIKNCKFFGIYCSEIKVGDQVLVIMYSRELFVYTPLNYISDVLELKNGTSSINLSSTSDNKNTITITSDKVIVNSPNVIINSDSIKLGSDRATFTPLCLEDLSSILYIPGDKPAIPLALSGVPKIQKSKLE